MATKKPAAKSIAAQADTNAAPSGETTAPAIDPRIIAARSDADVCRRAGLRNGMSQQQTDDALRAVLGI